jgi:hypothetical protein
LEERGEGKCINSLVGKMKKRDYSNDLGENGKVILKQILRKQDWRTWTVIVWLRIWTGGERV